MITRGDLNGVHVNGVQYSESVTPPRNSDRHDRESVARAALALLDEVGLADLSMRRIAARLDLQPSALYWHFDSKQALFAALADLITAEITHDDATVLTTARRIRDALFTYRDGAELVLSTSALRLGSSSAQRALETALRAEHDDIVLPHSLVTATATALLHFILGHAALVQQRMHADSHGAILTDAAAPDAPTAPDSTAGLNEVFDLGVRALSSSPQLVRTLRRDRAESRE